MKKNRQKIIDVFPDAFTGGGIFTALQAFPVPWGIDDIALDLDLEYYGNISGEKFISPLIDKLKESLTLSEDEINKLASVIYTMYGVNWARQWDTLFFEYNPIENYSMLEKMTDDTTVTEYGRTHTKTNNLTYKKTGTVGDNATKTGTDTVVNGKTGTDTVSPNVTVNDNNSVYAFNSSSPVPTNAGSNTTTGNTNTTYNTTDTNTTTYNTSDNNTTTYNTSDKDTGTVTDGDTGTDTNTRNYTLTRTGNIGTVTAQQMATEERNLYMWQFFYSVVFPDIDKVLAINIY